MNLSSVLVTSLNLALKIEHRFEFNRIKLRGESVSESRERTDKWKAYSSRNNGYRLNLSQKSYRDQFRFELKNTILISTV